MTLRSIGQNQRWQQLLSFCYRRDASCHRCQNVTYDVGEFFVICFTRKFAWQFSMQPVTKMSSNDDIDISVQWYVLFQLTNVSQGVCHIFKSMYQLIWTTAPRLVSQKVEFAPAALFHNFCLQIWCIVSVGNITFFDIHIPIHNLLQMCFAYSNSHFL